MSQLVSSDQDLIAKWEKYVTEHQVYEQRIHDYREWMGAATKRLDDVSQPVGDQESLEERRAIIQVDHSIELSIEIHLCELMAL